MIFAVYDSPEAANEAAAAHLGKRLSRPSVRNVMLATGNTPLELYRQVSQQCPHLSHLTVFALDEYVGVPLDEPRNCANVLRKVVAEAWRLDPGNFHTVSSLPEEAQQSVEAHERKLKDAGGLDLIVLGLGQNGHLGFNEPGSARNSMARVLPLEPISIEANRKWFEGRYAPACGATIGLRTILSAQEVFVLAFGTHKRVAAQAMIHGPVSDQCPASFLQAHPNVKVFLDKEAASELVGPACT